MRQQANNIIVSLLQSDELTTCLNKVKESLRDDLKGELSLILLETPADRILRLEQEGKFKFYVVRIILTLAFSKTSPFYKKYKSYNELHDLSTIDDDYYSIIHRKQTEEKALTEIEKLEWYESEMVKLYLKEGNYRAMESATRIPYTSCFKTVQSAVKKIKQKIA